jgi:hypothetical protein
MHHAPFVVMVTGWMAWWSAMGPGFARETAITILFQKSLLIRTKKS